VSGASSALARTLEELRREFDRGFALAPQGAREVGERFIALRVGGEPCAIRLAEIAGLHAAGRVLPLPSGLASLLGAAGLRGRIVAVHDLAVLLGHGAGGKPRWLALARGADSIALGFEAFESQIVAAPGDVIAADGAAARQHARAAVRSGQALRPIVDLPSVIEEIRRLARTPQVPKEA